MSFQNIMLTTYFTLVIKKLSFKQTFFPIVSRLNVINPVIILSELLRQCGSFFARTQEVLDENKQFNE